MNNLKIQDTVMFELYNCIGIVLKVVVGKSFIIQTHQVLTFNPASKTIGSRERSVPSNNWYSNDGVVYQILIGNHKAWLSHRELQAALIGDDLP